MNYEKNNQHKERTGRDEPYPKSAQLKWNHMGLGTSSTFNFPSLSHASNQCDFLTHLISISHTSIVIGRWWDQWHRYIVMYSPQSEVTFEGWVCHISNCCHSACCVVSLWSGTPGLPMMYFLWLQDALIISCFYTKLYLISQCLTLCFG